MTSARVVERDSGHASARRASAVVADAKHMGAVAAKSASMWTSSGMADSYAIAATMYGRVSPSLACLVEEACCCPSRKRIRAGVLRVGKSGALMVAAEAGLEAMLPKLPLCIWCGAALDDGSSSAAGRPCVRGTAERLSTRRCLKVLTHCRPGRVTGRSSRTGWEAAAPCRFSRRRPRQQLS